MIKDFFAAAGKDFVHRHEEWTSIIAKKKATGRPKLQRENVDELPTLDA